MPNVQPNQVTTAPRNLRAEWDDSPELRQSVKEELRNWAQWSRERPMRAPYDRQPWYTPPRDQRDKRLPSAPCDAGLAEETEGCLLRWRDSFNEYGLEGSGHIAAIMFAFDLHYLTKKTAIEKAEILSVSRSKFYRLLDEAHFEYWAASSA